MISSLIKDQLSDYGTFGTDLFVSSLPDSPDNCIVVYDEPGTVQPYQSDYGSDWAGVQILVRGSYSYVQKIWDIHNDISALENIDSTKFVLVRSLVQTVPSQVDIDDKGRRIYTAHYMYLINPKTTGRIPVYQP